MAQHIGTFERDYEDVSPTDPQADDEWFELDYTDLPTFATNNVTTLTLTVETPPAGVTAPSLGSPSYATANKPLFRIYGGGIGDVRVRAVAVNAASPPNKIVKVFTVSTK